MTIVTRWSAILTHAEGTRKNLMSEEISTISVADSSLLLLTCREIQKHKHTNAEDGSQEVISSYVRLLQFKY